jgi:glucose dehydrogenase
MNPRRPESAKARQGALGGTAVMRDRRSIGTCLLVILLSAAATLSRAQRPQSGEWRYFGGDKGFTRYSSLDQINRDTVKNLRVVWRRPATNDSLKQAFPELRVNAYLRSTPIMIDGMLYTQDVHGFVSAFDAGSGETLWQQEPFARTQEEVAGQSTRGVDYWQSGADQRIFAIRGEYLYALNAKTGKPLPDFGDRGRASLHFEENQPLAGRFNDSTGPLVVGNVVVVTGNTAGAGDGGDKKEAAPENVRGFDARDGRLLWTFHVVPQAGELGNETWGNESWKVAGDIGAWNPMSADEQLGYVYIPLTAPTASAYGGWRPGDNLYSDCLVALDAKTGRRVWHFQMIHHDLWEYDNVGPAILGDTTVGGTRIKAVMQPNKNGFLYVLNRATGEPVWPIVERAVPPSTVPTEHASPTQPFPTKPPAFDRQGITEDDLIDFTPELRKQALEVIKPFVLGPLYTPPSIRSDEVDGKKGTLTIPGAWGAGNWHTGAFDPETGFYYAVSLTLPGVRSVISTKGNPQATMDYAGPGGGPTPTTQAPGFVQGLGTQVQGLPITKPPYGRITAFDLNTGERVWLVANGDGPRSHPLLKDLNLPPLGTPNRPAPLLTKTLLFIGEGSDAVIGTPQVSWGWGKKFRAYDKATGKVVWETELPSGSTGAPMTYLYKGKQYVVVPVGAKDHPAELVAMALSDARQPSSGEDALR